MAPLSLQDAVEAPELLVLATLDATLVSLRVAIVASFPELLNELARTRDPPLLVAARRLSDLTWRLERAVGDYREQLERARAPCPESDDLPF